jgi:hypothetical protein
VLQAQPPQRPHRPDGHQVLRREERRGRVGAPEEGGDRAVGDTRIAHVAHHERRVHRQPEPPQRLLVAGVALPGGGDGRAVPEERDAPMPGGGEMAHALRRPDLVGGDHRVDREVVRLAVHADDRRARAQLGGQVRLVVARRNEQQAVDVAGAERLRECALAGGVLVEARRVDHHSPVLGLVLDGALHGGGERVGDVLEEQPDRCRPAIRPAQDAGSHVGTEVELVDRLPHAPLERG